MPRSWLPQARQSAGCFSSRDAITISSPCGAREASSAHLLILGDSECCAIWELMCSGNHRRDAFFSWLQDHPLLREERGNLSACTWSSCYLRTTNELRQGLAFLDKATLTIWFLDQQSCLASPCSGDYENALQGCLRSDATFISALLFEKPGLHRITFHRIIE